MVNRRTKDTSILYDPEPLVLARARQGMTLAELAGKVGKNISTVSLTLRGLRSHPPTVRKLAEHLNVDPERCWRADGPQEQAAV